MSLDGTINEVFAIFFNFPPSFPNRQIDSTPNFVAVLTPLIMFIEFPLVEIPINRSLVFTSVSICLANMVSKLKSLLQAVIKEVSVV